MAKRKTTRLRTLRVYLRLILSIIFVTVNTFSPLSHANNISPNEESLLNFAKDAIPEATRRAKAWGDEQDHLIETIVTMAEKLQVKAQRLEKQRGAQKLYDMIEAGEVLVNEPGIGKIEYTHIEGLPIAKLVLNINGEARNYLLIDEQKISRNSRHLQQYIARQNHWSERDVTVVAFHGDLTDSNQITNITDAPRPKWTEWRWWKGKFLATYRNPNANDVSLAVYTGIALQGALTAISTFVKGTILGIPVDFTSLSDLAPTLFTMFYGLSIGTFISTYKNFTQHPGLSKFARITRQQLFSAFYAYGYVLAVTGGDMGDRLATISFLTASGLATNFSIFANGFMNNFAKDYWNQITILRERARKSIGNINFKVFGKEISWRRSSFEYQHLYLIPWLINVISLTTLATTDWLKIPGTDITVPLLQLAGIPIAMQWARKYSRKIAKEAENDPELKDRAKELHELADRYEKEWQKIVGPFSRFANWIKGAIDARLGVSAPEIDNLDLRTKPHLVDPPETGDDDPTPWLRSSECEKALSKRSA